MLKFEVRGATLIVRKYPKEIHIKFESEFDLKEYLTSIIALL